MSGERRRAIEARVAAAAARLEKEGRYTATRRCIQHGKVSVYAHCVSVADTACVLAEMLHLRVNERADNGYIRTVEVRHGSKAADPSLIKKI